MFFAPPKVKSLSKYSEFGSHMGEREFLAAFLTAVFVHLAFIWVYSQQPYEHPVVIPVRVLNIKLAPGNPGLEMPKLSDMPTYAPPLSPDMPMALPPRAEPVHNEKSPQAAANKIYNNSQQKSLVSILSQNTHKKHEEHAAEKNLSTALASRPKKYIRESELATLSKSGNANGNGTDMAGSQTGSQVAEKYEQELSLWLQNHQKFINAQGRSVVRIRINREGHVLYSAIEISSGNAVLDQATLEMVHNSDPFPRAPDNYPAARELEFLIPVSFEFH